MNHVHNIRTIFFSFLTIYQIFCRQISYICTLNFKKAGYRKGVPVGVRVTLKKNANTIVREDYGSESYEKSMFVLKIKCAGIKLKEITAEEISQIYYLLNNQEINTFTGSNKVHRITYYLLQNIFLLDL